MADNDPIPALAVGLNEESKASRKAGGKSAGAKAGAEAKAEATAAGSTTDEAEALETVVAEKVDEAVPPAPGDEPATVFERRLERLDRLVEEADFETGSAFGDLRDVVLDLFKHRPKIWAQMSKSEQQDCIRAIEAASKRIISKVVLVVAQEDSEAIEATLLAGFNVKGDALEAKLKIDNIDGDLLLDVYKLAGHRVMVVAADDKRFMNARRDAETQDDQPDMFGGDAKGSAPAADPVEPKPEPSDEDLADGDNSPSGVDVAKGQAEAEGEKWGVYDEGGEEWLATIAEGETDDDWQADKAKAVGMDRAAAEKLAGEYGGGSFVARNLG